MVVSDRAINDMLQQLTTDSLTGETLQAIVNGLHTGRRISMARLFEALRTEMLASQLAQSFRISISDVPPAQKFEYFSRLNRRAKAEVVPLAVADFTSQVANPDDATLQKFFDKYKDQYPDATSPEPGFKEPQRAAFQYFKADFGKLRDEMKAKVTDEEIAEYYEKNKVQFRQLDLPKEPGAEAPPEEGDKPAEPSAETPGEPKAETPEEPKPETPAPPADEAKPEEAKPEEPKTEEPKAEAPPQEDAAKPEQSSANGTSARFHLVSVSADEPAAAAQEEAAPAAETAPPADDKPAETPASEPAATPASEPAAPDKPADAPAADAKSAEAPAATTPPAEPAAAQPEEPKYEPLEKVKEQIRDSIASQKAAARITEIFEEISSRMRRYANERDDYEARGKSDKTLEAPAPFPFAELAKKYGIEARDLPLVTAAEAAAEDIGKVSRIVPDSRSRMGFRSEAFVEFAFSDSLPTYKYTSADDNEGNGFLFWKTEEQQPYVPKFAQVHDKVLAAWKMIEARTVAQAGRRIGGTSSGGQQAPEGSLRGSVGAESNRNRVVHLDDHGQRAAGSLGAVPRISEIEGVERIGDDFMKTVFGLQAGQIGVASNHPQDTMYVVRLAEYEQPIDQLRNEFAIERPGMYMMAAGADQQAMIQAWISHLEKEADVHWVCAPDVAGPGDVESPLEQASL